MSLGIVTLIALETLARAPLDCQQLEYSTEESEFLVTQSVSALPINVRAEGFEESKIWKCLSRGGKTSFWFKGILKSRPAESELSQVPYVTCSFQDIHNPESGFCAFDTLQLLTVPDIRVPVSLGNFGEFQSIDEALSALAYLRTLVGTEISGKKYRIDEYVAVTQLDLYRLEDGLVFIASYSTDGCAYFATSIRAARNGRLHFGEAGRIDGIC